MRCMIKLHIPMGFYSDPTICPRLAGTAALNPQFSPGRIIPAFLLAAIFLSACVQAPVENRLIPSWDARKNELTGMETWNLKGRIAVRTNDESGSGSLHWAQRRDEYDLRVIAPFSGGVYELSGTAGNVSLRAPDNSVLQAGDAESLLQQAAGWRFPVSEMVFWIRGLPAPSLQVDRLLLDGENRVSELSQGGWSIRYKRYTGVGGVSMPARLDLENGEVSVRLSVREWNLD
ncbi:MAG: lipoprotein insertase outer membrane protein LolB [Gammaproteobacteria bacterium]|nr:lipoprotein insertase outer membrane protein LolB [Gammaproteobacteria bacterium]